MTVRLGGRMCMAKCSGNPQWWVHEHPRGRRCCNSNKRGSERGMTAPQSWKLQAKAGQGCSCSSLGECGLCRSSQRPRDLGVI